MADITDPTTAPFPNPPEWMQAGESSLADGARRHAQEVSKKRSLGFSASSESRKDSEDKGKARATIPPVDIEPISVDFKDKRKKAEEEGKLDKFRWATLYENQRGITIFSTAYYSGRSLLPHDPLPFTVPETSDNTPHHSPSNVTPATYPLPDPTWRWISNSWLVDMRGDGDVQHDGFEYNWFFRRSYWRSQVGWFSAGGFVRRRRWVRLMMRPSEARLQAETAIEEYRRAEDSDSTETSQEGNCVWKGDEDDWNRLRGVLKTIARDGPKLDLWMDWLSHLIAEEMSTAHYDTKSTEDEFTDNAPERKADAAAGRSQMSHERPSREWVITVIREHGQDLGSFFVYPDSRAQLRDLLMKAGLVQDILIVSEPGPHVPSSAATHVPYDLSSQFLGPSDFWSRNSLLSLNESTGSQLNKE